jgi:hypothetical protein
VEGGKIIMGIKFLWCLLRSVDRYQLMPVRSCASHEGCKYYAAAISCNLKICQILKMRKNKILCSF